MSNLPMDHTPPQRPGTAWRAADGTLRLHLANESATAALGAALATALVAAEPATRPVRIALRGDLGAGKTTLVRALLRTLGWQGPVKSPTFALLEPYTVYGFDIYHFDLYRFCDEAQWFDAGFDDIWQCPGLHLVEWPERAGSLLDGVDITCSWLADHAVPPPVWSGDPAAAPEQTVPGIPVACEGRSVCMSATTPTGTQCLDRLTESLTLPDAASCAD